MGNCVGKPIEIGVGVPDVMFYFRNQPPLKAQEALHALDLLLGWEGLEVTQADKGLKVLPRNEAK